MHIRLLTPVAVYITCMVAGFAAPAASGPFVEQVDEGGFAVSRTAERLRQAEPRVEQGTTDYQKAILNDPQTEHGRAQAAIRAEARDAEYGAQAAPGRCAESPSSSGKGNVNDYLLQQEGKSARQKMRRARDHDPNINDHIR